MSASGPSVSPVAVVKDEYLFFLGTLIGYIISPSIYYFQYNLIPHTNWREIWIGCRQRPEPAKTGPLKLFRGGYFFPAPFSIELFEAITCCSSLRHTLTDEERDVVGGPPM